MTDAVRKELERAQQMHRSVSEALVGDYATDMRGSLFAAFVSVCMSHHEAITLLVMNERLTGSALALCRPLVEAACRGLYVAYEADDRQLESIAKGAEPYPPFKQLIAMLDARLSVGNLFAQYSEVWKSLNDFTHGGVFQLATRIDEYGNVGTHHTDETTVVLLRGSTSALMRIAIAFIGNLKSPEAGDALGNMYISLYGPTPATGYLH